MEEPRLYEVYLLEAEIIALKGRIKEATGVLNALRSKNLKSKYKKELKHCKNELKRKEELWNTMLQWEQ